ncbi:MAG: SO_0444 family Cu/Zn efflux transporter [Nitrospirota bacterium]
MDFLREIFYFFNESAIYILFGFLVAGLLKIVLPTEKVFKYLGKKETKSVVRASLLGIPIPLCSCAVLPTAMSLKKQGASKGATISFLISTPETGVDSISITYALIDPLMTVFRPVAALITAITAGIAANIMDKKPSKDALQMVQNTSCACSDTCCDNETHEKHSRGKLGELFHYAFVDLLNDIMGWLVLGIVIAALISVLLPENFFESYIGSGPLSMVIMLLVGIPIYMCAASSTPVAAALILKGLNPGAALVFLLAGPATNIGTTAAVGKFLGKKMMVVYLGTIIIVSILLGLLLNEIYAVLGIHPSAIVGQASEIIPSLIKLSGSLILLLLMLINLYRTGIKNTLRAINNTLADFIGFRISIGDKIIDALFKETNRAKKRDS